MGSGTGGCARYRLADYRGRWVMVFFYPADFTFVCPTEILGFHAWHTGLEFGPPWR